MPEHYATAFTKIEYKDGSPTKFFQAPLSEEGERALVVHVGVEALTREDLTDPPTGMMNLQSAPRDAKNIRELKRGIRLRLAVQIDMFESVAHEHAFLSASEDHQTLALVMGLARYDLQLPQKEE